MGRSRKVAGFPPAVYAVWVKRPRGPWACVAEGSRLRMLRLVGYLDAALEKMILPADGRHPEQSLLEVSDRA